MDVATTNQAAPQESTATPGEPMNHTRGFTLVYGGCAESLYCTTGLRHDRRHRIL